MNQQDLYSTIFKRKSIRKYKAEPLNKEVLDKILKEIKTLVPLYNNIRTEINLVTQKDIKSIIPVNAPHYAVVFSETKDGYLTNIGYMLQQLDLYLSSNGLGSCWLGIPRPSKEVKESSALEFVIMMSFGIPAEPIYRESLSEFIRKPLEKMTDLKSCNQLLEPVRLAPSATNSQPWFFSGNEQLLQAYCIKPGLLKAFIYEKMNKIDMGIALYHLELSAKHNGNNIEFTKSVTPSKSPSGYYYISSIKLT